MSALRDLAREAGLRPDFRDQTGTWREAPDETIRAVLAAEGREVSDEAEAAEALLALRAERERRLLPDWVVCPAGVPHRLDRAPAGDWTIDCEDGHQITGSHGGGALDLPPLPVGRHSLRAGEERTWLLSAPERLPPPTRAWGVTLPLYGLPPRHGGGLGSYADLADWARVLGSAGAAFVGINPVHAGLLGDAEAFSPYAPSHRRRFSTLHITAGEAPMPLAPLVDYPEALRHRAAAQEAAFAATRADPTFVAWRAAEGPPLERFATHQALAEVHGAYWTDWPAVFQDPETPEVARFAAAQPERLAFHAWLQWQAEAQLAAAAGAARDAGMALGLYLDLAVGTHPAGAETWAERRLFAPGMSLGAPPDAFSTNGQTWGVAPFSPRVLAETGFVALAETLRAQLRFAGLLRIDHILGFERAFWVPEDAGLPGLYVQMPRDALMAVTRIEAARAGASVVGEDLGNVPEGLREAMHAAGILGCRVAVFETDGWTGGFRDPAHWDAEVLASFATHDLPTWKGWRKGRDIDWRARTGAAADAAAETDARACDVRAFDAAVGGAPGDAGAMHGFLARSASRLVAVQAEDLLDLDEQANLPGTVHEHPNWRRRLPVGPDELEGDARLAALSRLMESCGRQGDPQ